MTLDQLDTPALVVDLEVMEQNLKRMADYCRRHGLQLRPHTKTHKIPALAARQVQLGAQGITVAKLGEAEVMAAEGLSDILLAYPLLGEAKARRLGALLEQASLTVALDSLESAQWLSRAAGGHRVGVLVEVDLGMRRCGLPPGPEAVHLAREVDRLPHLTFQGILFYSGHVHPDYDGNEESLQRLNQELGALVDLFRREGPPLSVVSGGSTPSAFYSHRIQGLSEIRPGTYIFNDRNTLEWKACREEDCAAFMLVTVVSTAVPGQAIIDGGSKTFTSDPLMPGRKGGFGLVRGFPEIQFVRMNEEHGYLRLPPQVRLQVGQKLQIIPNHICAAVNMHDVLFACRGEEVVEEWPVKARGKIR